MSGNRREIEEYPIAWKEAGLDTWLRFSALQGSEPRESGDSFACLERVTLTRVTRLLELGSEGASSFRSVACGWGSQNRYLSHFHIGY